jgi:hypothetical protein
MNIAIPDHSPTVAIKVDFYDNKERESFLRTPFPIGLQNLPITLTLPTPEVLTYYLYYKKQPGVPGYSTHDEVAQRWYEALVEFNGQLTLSNHSIRRIPNVTLDTGTTERVGEALSLSVASYLHGLHEADWGRIPESNTRKSLDFQYPLTASDGKRFIQLEAKGSSTDNNDNKSDSVTHHKASIRAKKNAATSEERQESVMYGMIGVIDDRRDSAARCWLVDPPANMRGDPKRLRIINRLDFITSLISLISPRSVFAAALQTRLSAINAVEDVSALDGIPLIKGNGEPFPFKDFLRSSHTPLLGGRSMVLGGQSVGDVAVVAKDVLLFVGIDEGLIPMVAGQTFGEIEEYRFESQMMPETVQCVVSKGRFDKTFKKFITLPGKKPSVSGGYVYFNIDGYLIHSESGLVVGVLPIPPDLQGH